MTTCLLEKMTGMYVYLRWNLARFPLQFVLRSVQSSYQHLSTLLDLAYIADGNGQ